MARKLTVEQIHDELLERFGVEIARAFDAVVADIRNAANLQLIVTAIERGDIEGVVQALNLEPAAYGRLLEQVRSAYVEGGNVTSGFIRPPGGVRVLFDVRNERAERWLKTRSSDLVTGIIADQREAVRARLEDGMEAGRAPRSVGLEIVGRVNRATGKREGGILGLTAQQEQFSCNARDELASGDPARMKEYLGRSRRDRRFDRTIEKAIRNGEPLPAETIRKAVGRYEARLLELRGQMIGRTEAMTALRASKHEAHLQLVESGKVAESAVTKIWSDSSDLRVRHTHAILDGKKAALKQPFVSPSGARLMFPGDPSAPAAEIVGCRCDVIYDVDFLASLR